jgi:hypothetical protein
MLDETPSLFVLISIETGESSNRTKNFTPHIQGGNAERCIPDRNKEILEGWFRQKPPLDLRRVYKITH